MERNNRIATIIAALLAGMLFINGCQRLAQPTGKEIEPEIPIQTSPANTPIAPTIKDDVGYLVPVSLNEGFSPLYGYQDLKGNIIINYQFKRAHPFYECGLAEVSDMNGKRGIINKSGNYVIEPKYDFIEYTEGVFVCKDFSNDIYEVFDQTGIKRFEVNDFLSGFSEGMAVVSNKGYVDKSGQLVISLPGYRTLKPFVNGLAVVREKYSSDTHYIDKQGKDVTQTVSSGLWLFEDEDRLCYGYRDAQGKVVIEPAFSEAEPFLGGFAIVRLSGEYYGVIDTQGRYVLEPVYCGIERLSNGLVAVGEELKHDMLEPSEYYDFAYKALFTPDFSFQTDWIYTLAEDFDNKYICVNDEDSIFFMDVELNPVEHMPTFQGFGSFMADGELLRGKYNGHSSVVDSNGKFLTNGLEPEQLRNGLMAQRIIKSTDRYHTLEYPQLLGLHDEAKRNRLNELILQEMVIPFEEELLMPQEPGDHSSFISTYTINCKKNLIIIVQIIYFNDMGIHGFSYFNMVYLDIEKAVVYTLDDLFRKDKDAYAFLSEIVPIQSPVVMGEEGYWDPGVTIRPSDYYIIAEEGLTVYDEQYGLPPYIRSWPSHLIPYTDLMDYIDTEGDFWKSFN